jgi:MoaA/NifB/PqqE/SkfB family radical SAM enzyme
MTEAAAEAAAGSYRSKLRALQLAQPLTVQLELTYACNWRCVFCYNPRHFDRTRLSGEEWIAVLDELRALGALTVALTGGEPLAHPDFFAIAEAARARAFALRIFTNASLIDDAAADRIAVLPPLAVEVSIHGATAEVHDAATKKPGSFTAALAGIDRLLARNVPLLMKTPITSLNEHQIDGIVTLAAARDLALQIDPHITPRDDGNLDPLQYGASQAAVRRVLALGLGGGSIPSIERAQGGANCGIGRLTLAIDAEGNVFPCMQWRFRPIGNVRTSRLRELWHASDVRRDAAAMAVHVNDTLLDRGGAVATYPFCPALAMQETGDPTTPDASFRMRAAIAADLRAELP